MKKESKPLTAFTMGLFGFYECKRRAFRLTNDPVNFQWLIETCLGDLKKNWCIIYLDDIIIYLKGPTSHHSEARGHITETSECKPETEAIKA